MLLVAYFEQIANGGPGSGPHPGGGHSLGKSLAVGQSVTQRQHGKVVGVGKVSHADATHITIDWGNNFVQKYPRDAVGTASLPGISANSNPEGHNQYTGKASHKFQSSSEAKEYHRWAERSAPPGVKTVHQGAVVHTHLSHQTSEGLVRLESIVKSQTSRAKKLTTNSGTNDHDIYETLTRNYSAPKSRKETLDGREYLVVPMTMIVPGVLNGSKGSLFYPPEEVGKDPTPWNGMPITVYHPVRNGRNVSARDPEVLQSQGIGMVMRSRSGDKLRAEAWIDVKKAQTVAMGQGILDNLRAGKPVEISTGLFTDNTEQAGDWNGKRYTHVARNYRPDHLAILPDQRGACSVDDGCGLMMNHEQEVTDNDWAEWNAKNKRGFTGGDHTQAKKEGFKDAHDKMKFEETDKRHVSRDKRMGAKAKSTTPMAPKSDKAGKLAEKASKLEGKHSANGVAAREKASALVKESMKKAKAFHGGDQAESNHHFKQAKKAAIGYSQTRAKQHEQVAKAHAAAGNHAKAAHFQARADFHKAYVNKLKSAKMTTNSNPEGINQYTVHGDPAMGSTTVKFGGVEIGHTSQLGKRKWKAVHQGKTVASAAANHEVALAAIKGAHANSHITNVQLMPTGEREFVMNQLATNVKGMSTDDVGEAVRSAFREAHPYPLLSGLVDATRTPDLRDVFDDYHVYRQGDELYRQDHELKDGKCTMIGSPTLVKRVTSYKPVDNQEQNMLTANERSEIIEALIENSCGCWKSGDEAILGQFSDERLRGIAENNEEVVESLPWLTENAHVPPQFAKKKAKDDDEYEEDEDEEDDEELESGKSGKKKAVTNGGPGSGPHPGGGSSSVYKLPKIDDMRDALTKKGVKHDHISKNRTLLEQRTQLSELMQKHGLSTNQEEGEIMAEDKPVKLTRDEIWNMLDPEDREAITNAHDIVTKAKAELVTKLTANVKDEATKTRLVTNLGTKSLDELRDLELLAPAPVENKQAPVLRPVFGPTGNSFTTDAVSNEEADIMGMISPRIDWAELAKSNDSRNRTVNAN